MRKLKLLFAISVVVLCFCSVPVRAETRQYLLGDIDGFIYNGVGSVDDVYVDPAWLNWVSQNPANTPVRGFDILAPEQFIPFTFRFDLTSDKQVIGATLTLGLRSTNSDNWGGLLLSTIGTQEQWRPSFGDLSWNPIAETGTTIRSVDLSNLYGYSIIPILQGGLLDAGIRGNVAVDYAQLTLEVVPEPMSILLFAGGMLFTRRLSKKN